MATNTRLTELKLGYSEMLTAKVLGYAPGTPIGHKLLSIVPCTEQGARLPVFKADMLKITESKRALRQNPKTVPIDVTYTNVSFDEHALAVPIDYREQRAAEAVGSPVDPTAVASRKSKRLVTLGREYDIATLFQDTTKYASNQAVTVSSGSAKWDYMSGGVSSQDIVSIWKTACQKIRSMTGQRPNVGWMGAKVWEAVQLNTTVLGRWRYAPAQNAAPVTVSPQMFCQAVGIDELYIGDMVYSTDGQTIAGDIWQDSAGLLVKNELSESEEPTYGVLAMEQFGSLGDASLFGFVSAWVEPGGFISQVAYVEHYQPWVAMNTAGFLWLATLT